MTDFFLRIGLSNVCLSLALAIVAMAVGAKAKRPHLAHLLWLLVFVKLVTPPIVTIPVVTIPRQPETAIAIKDHSQQGSPLTNNREFDVGEQRHGATAQMSESAADASLSARIRSVMLNQGRTWLSPIWLLGSVVVFAWSLVRVYRDAKKTIDFMGKIKKPWIAYKVLAAGAIHPIQAFDYSFKNGADFILAGMFDFQVTEDAIIAKQAIARNQVRQRPWLA